jgi:hypothetical protein
LKTGLVVQSEAEAVSWTISGFSSVLAMIMLRKALWWKLRLMVCDELVFMGRLVEEDVQIEVFSANRILVCREEA